MNSKYFYSMCLILVVVIIACSFRQKEDPIDPKVLPGRYCHSTDERDSIFIYPDSTYKHSYHRRDGILKTQTGNWHYEPDDISFEGFVFYNDEEPGPSGYFSGTWAPRVFVTEKREVKLRYSESVYYVKMQEK